MLLGEQCQPQAQAGCFLLGPSEKQLPSSQGGRVGEYFYFLVSVFWWRWFKSEYQSLSLYQVNVSLFWEIYKSKLCSSISTRAITHVSFVLAGFYLVLLFLLTEFLWCAQDYVRAGICKITSFRGWLRTELQICVPWKCKYPGISNPVIAYVVVARLHKRK